MGINPGDHHEVRTVLMGAAQQVTGGIPNSGVEAIDAEGVPHPSLDFFGEFGVRLRPEGAAAQELLALAGSEEAD